jgi:hypothetical protein
MPDDKIYLPVHVGKEGKSIDLPYQPDNTGDNISGKNNNFCELTAVYWAYKNLDADYIGLAHYRRHFRFKRKSGKWESVLTENEARHILKRHDIILPNKRRYFIETNYSHYIHAHENESIAVLKEIIKNDYPEYEAACHSVMNRTWAHMFNMFIMNKDCFDNYCKWLFDILFKIEGRLDISGYTKNERRVFGFLSELMLDIWITANEKIYYECPVMFMEKQNWLVKGGKFVWRKFFGK